MLCDFEGLIFVSTVSYAYSIILQFGKQLQVLKTLLLSSESKILTFSGQPSALRWQILSLSLPAIIIVDKASQAKNYLTYEYILNYVIY